MARQRVALASTEGAINLEYTGTHAHTIVQRVPHSARLVKAYRGATIAASEREAAWLQANGWREVKAVRKIAAAKPEASKATEASKAEAPASADPATDSALLEARHRNEQ